MKNIDKIYRIYLAKLFSLSIIISIIIVIMLIILEITTLKFILLSILLISTGLFLSELSFNYINNLRFGNLDKRHSRGLRMKPHIFAHFLPSQSYPDIDNKGFRRSSPRNSYKESSSKDNSLTIYIAGDCTVFEDHLRVEDSFAYKLNQIMPSSNILNGGCPHYTSLHSYNRFVVDLHKGILPDRLLFCASANDVLSFVHHKGGLISADHSHLYTAWKTNLDLLEKPFLSSINSSIIKYMIYRIIVGKSDEWTDMVEDISPKFNSMENIKVAKQLFNHSNIEKSLKMFSSTCREFNIELVLATFLYNEKDMVQTEARSFYKDGIDSINDYIRSFSKINSIKLIDLAKDVQTKDNYIENKWHFTALGNKQRAELAAKYLIAT